nr:sensor histidine kinase [uncultured Blautia sp.]
MSGKKYLKDHGMALVIWGLEALILESILWMFHVRIPVQIFAFSVQFLAIFLIFYWDFSRKKEFYCEMEEKLNTLEEKYLLIEMLRQPEFLEGKLFYETMVQMEKSMNDEIYGQIRKNNEFKQYIETWVHEIKLPIASMRLLLKDYRGGSARILKEQLARIESYVEQVLYYLRSQVPEKDYVIQEYSLRKITDRVIGENKDSLIGNHVRILQETEDVCVLTDEKWLGFLVGQIFSNAVKYRKGENPCIRLWSEVGDGPVRLHIRDNGIGIPTEDLPRVFEKSFTGKNGRTGQASTGIGLYLCKELADRLGHKIEVFSEEGEYTEVVLSFEKGGHVNF